MNNSDTYLIIPPDRTQVILLNQSYITLVQCAPQPRPTATDGIIWIKYQITTTGNRFAANYQTQIWIGIRLDAISIIKHGVPTTDNTSTQMRADFILSPDAAQISNSRFRPNNNIVIVNLSNERGYAAYYYNLNRNINTEIANAPAGQINVGTAGALTSGINMVIPEGRRLNDGNYENIVYPPAMRDSIIVYRNLPSYSPVQTPSVNTPLENVIFINRNINSYIVQNPGSKIVSTGGLDVDLQCQGTISITNDPNNIRVCNGTTNTNLNTNTNVNTNTNTNVNTNVTGTNSFTTSSGSTIIPGILNPELLRGKESELGLLNANNCERFEFVPPRLCPEDNQINPEEQIVRRWDCGCGDENSSITTNTNVSTNTSFIETNTNTNSTTNNSTNNTNNKMNNNSSNCKCGGNNNNNSGNNSCKCEKCNEDNNKRYIKCCNPFSDGFGVTMKLVDEGEGCCGKKNSNSNNQ